MTEFIGVTAGLTLIGIPLVWSDIFSLVLVVSLTLFNGYWHKERLVIVLTMMNVVFFIVAFLTHPNPAAIEHTFLAWNVPADAQGSVIWYIAATIGNAIASPWMIFFQSNAVIDKGLTSKDLRFGRIDTLIGCVVETLIAIAVILCGAALFDHVQNLDSSNPAFLISALTPFVGRLGSTLFGLGLFNAACLGAMTISLSTSWTIAGAFGWKKSLNDKISEAPQFYTVYIGSLLLAAGIILLPSLPLNFIAVLTQVVVGVLLVPMLIFLMRFTSNRIIMGEYANGRFQRIWGWMIVGLLIVMSLMALWQTVMGRN